VKIIEQDYEILSDPDLRKQLQLIELAGRTAYKSEDRITDNSAKEFASMITKRGHEAVLEHSFMSVKFITDRGVSHELVRHRLCSFTQESTRYCNYSKDKFDNQLTFIWPVWYEQEETASAIWLKSICQSEIDYLVMLEHGWNPQQARSILPNSLKTEIVVSCNFRELKHIFQLRAISKAAHPQMRNLMIPLYNYCRKELPEIFEMGDPE